MFDLIDGIPLHPLVVHAVVVLLPLATLGTIAIVARPAWRLRFGPLVVAAAALSTALIPVATSSGEALERRVGDPGRHAELGDQLIWFAVPLLLLSAALVWLEWRRGRPGAPVGSRTLLNVVAALVVVAALASAVQVYRVGDSGARAAWSDAGTTAGK
ncbi:DUF2231 domain-containing protein [Nocardioides currus]|uniref:DUF2231 domain-containing protein n=1 Tax=Nocardioides currus TaxID=2133958 RepID=A0A2R7YZX8_9ACTN|nr:DUF2231 domain-containing protein [Nocardioides currus]PUA81911.1 hypothetical protein C7S10_07640 [Nocardioides currus]